ncbi:alkane 1-monooxygenase [Pararhodobacter oceanensis]|uniref:Alkane 1-monooxygenase n=1 Tax=Pararhodobacter oceanensis TaxID=2172121 RepID=A0A2T8HYR5_9RHOB|nr:alkane 1-monooxygenase [Pararhodobacter oceanensis]PVH30585.1 alkane 1-monooxygenase [Pararhodobacter oceanensis]
MRLAGFAFATLLPAVLLVAAALWGGVWVWAALAAITLFWLLMDRLTLLAPAEGEFPAGDGLLALLGVLQLTHLPLALWALTQRLHGVEWVAALIAFGLFFGQIGNPAAHELIHRADKRLMRLGKIIYIAFLFGHHTSAHRLVHHVHVGTKDDPNSARKGLGFWRFLPRAWIGSFRAGLAAERSMVARSGGKRRNPYPLYIGGALLALTLAALVFGPFGLLIYLILAAHAQSQLLVSDYVQHYGLRRKTLPDGRIEPIGTQHSWNAGGWYSAAMMLNAPRHSDHHSHPARPYPQLRLPADAPLLPAPLPAMAVLALVPPLWRRVMDPRVESIRLAAS